MELTREQVNEIRKRSIETAKQIDAVIADHTTVAAKGKQQTVDMRTALYLLTMKHGPQIITDIIAYTIAKNTEDHFSSVNTVWANKYISEISQEDPRHITLHWVSGVFACDINTAPDIINEAADLLRGGFAADQKEPEAAPPADADTDNGLGAEPEPSVTEPEPEEDSDSAPSDIPDENEHADPEAADDVPNMTDDDPGDAQRAVAAGDILAFNRLFEAERIQPFEFLPLYHEASRRNDKIGSIMAQQLHSTLHALYPRQRAALIYAAVAQGDMSAANSLLCQPVFAVCFPEDTGCLSLALQLSMDRRNLETAKKLIDLGADVEDFIRRVPEPDVDGEEFIHALLTYWNQGQEGSVK